MSNPTLVALQAALAAEHAIVYGLAVAGAQLPATEAAAVTIEWNANRQRRDQLIQLVTSFGGVPVTAKPVYSLPFRVDSPATAIKLIAHLESGAAGAAWDLVAASGPNNVDHTVRPLAVEWLTSATVAQQSLTGSAPALPGRPLKT